MQGEEKPSLWQGMNEKTWDRLVKCRALWRAHSLVHRSWNKNNISDIVI